MDHFDRIFEAGGSGSGGSGGSGGMANHVGPSEDDNSPFKNKKSGPPDFEFVS